jgi:PAS domain S-box-containing protein
MPTPPRIAIVGDRSGALDAVAAVLVQAGYEVTRAVADDMQAGDSAQRAPRVVLLDVPEQTHAELLQGCASRLLEAISTGEPLPTLLRMIALGVEEIVPSALVSILLVDPDGMHLRHGAAPSLPEPWLRAIDGASIGPAAGSCGTAVYRRELVIATDIEHDDFWADYRDLALAHDLRACWSTPVLGVAGDVLAAFAVYHREPRAPEPEDLQLLDRMAHVVRIAIERDRRERELHQSQSLLRMATQVSRLGAWSVELPGLEFSWSEEARAIHEVEPDVNPTIDDLIAFYVPEHRPRIRHLFEACVRDGTPFDVELRIVTARGRSLWVRAKGEAVRDEAGTLHRVQGALQDVTTQKQAEAERQHLAERLNATLESMTDAFCLIDPAWRFVFLNAEAERLLGRRREDLLGRGMWDAFPEGRQTIAYDEYHRAIADGQARHFELYYQPIERWLEVNAYPSVDGLAIYFRDQTDRRRNEDKLRESEAQLRQAQRLESVGQLTGGIAHDFNNMLTVILGNAHLLVEDLADKPEQLELAATIAGAAQRSAELTHRLLAFARKQPLEPKAVNVNLLVDGMDSLLRRTLGEHFEIALVRSAELGWAHVDPAQLESALLNLCLNARDAMPTGGRLLIETAHAWLDDEYAAQHADVQPGPYMEIAVSDTGFGIAPPHLTRVFEPFFTTKEVGKGSGLGLAMVYGFVKQSGGHISISSEPGKGTTVRMYLPRLADAVQEDDATITPTEVTGGSETILLVEDEALVRQYARAQLLDLGYRVIEAESGPQALAIIRQCADVDLLLTDMVMPGGMTGQQLTDEAVRLRPGLRVLHTSGYTEHASLHHGRLARGVLVLAKPYGRPELARKVRAALA